MLYPENTSEKNFRSAHYVSLFSVFDYINTHNTMKKHLLLIMLTLGFSHFAFAARGDKNKPTWLVGFSGGINLTQPSVLNAFGVTNQLGSTTLLSPKDYNPSINNMGHQFGFVIFYPAFGNLHLGLLPSYNTYQYGYQSEQGWTEETGVRLNNESNHTQTLRYFEIPLSIRYYVGTTNFKPYIEGIASYGMMHTADKTANSHFIRDKGSSSSTVQSTSLSADYSDSYITSQFNLGLGAGISYDLNQIILMLGASYHMNMNNVTNEKNRYANDLFVGSSYDVQDDLNLHALKINLSVIFPISKITKRSEIECNYFKQQREKRKR